MVAVAGMFVGEARVPGTPSPEAETAPGVSGPAMSRWPFRVFSETPSLEELRQPAPIPDEPRQSATVHAATVRVAAQGGQLTEEEVRAVLVAAGVPPEWHDAFVALSWCESKHSPYAVGDGGNSLGQWQLWSGWFPAAGESVDDYADPVVNARVALHVREVRGKFGGPGGWSCWHGPG